MALTDKLSAIADAIRDKTKTTEKMTLDRMPELIASITGGGGAAAEYVNFYDWDGKILHQYPLSIFEKMAALPSLPNSRKDCECVGWNMDIETIKAMKSHVNVAAIYNQKNEPVEEHTPSEPFYVDGTKLYFHFEHKLAISFYFRQTHDQGVTVHWGDGESSISGTGKGTSNLTLTHTYEPGDYVLSLEVADGCTVSLGHSSTSYSCIGYVGSINSTYMPVLNTLKKAEIDLRDTNLTSSAFRYCFSLEEVIFGNGKTTTIPSYTFDYCYGLERVQFSDDISVIYEYAFRACMNLRNIRIPTSVTSIGSYAFTDCRRLHDISIPGTVKTVSSYVFQNCTALKEVHLGSGVQTLGSYLFNSCTHLRKVNLPNTIKTLNSSTFVQCYALKEIVFPAEIKTIPSSFCQNCYALKNILIPNGVTTIGSSAFNASVRLQFAAIPGTVTQIADSAFVSCYALQNAVIGMGVQDIRPGAFQNCYGLEYIVIPPSVTKLGVRSFAYSKSLKNLVLPEHLMNFTSGIVACEVPSGQTQSYYQNLLETTPEILESAFDTNRTIENAVIREDLTAIGGSAFQYIYCLKKAEFPIGLLTIGTYAFRQDFQLKDVKLPVTLTTVGQNAFEQCHNIESITLPGSVRTVNSSAFVNCYGLESAEIRGNNMTFLGSVFSNCYAFQELRFAPGVTAVTISGSNFGNSGIESANLPQKVTFSGNSAFSACLCLEEADVTGAVSLDANITNSMFSSCYCLENVTLPDNLQAVGSSMFQYCYALTHIELGRYVNTIYGNGFYECRNLQEVRFLGNMLTSIQSNAFYYCWRLTQIRIPYSVTSMAQCFNGCFSLHNVYMYPLTAPTGTTNIGNLADGYVIHVPKGHLASYEKQWTGHAGHFAEFEYMAADKTVVRRTVGIHDPSVELKNAFVHTAFDEGQTFTITAQYDGKNLTVIKDLTFDYEQSMVTFGFDRAEEFDYDRLENMMLTITADGMEEVSCQFTVELRYLNTDKISEYEVINPSRYGFIQVDEDFYESNNKGVHGSYALARVNVITYTGKFFVDIIGGGEANYDYGIVSNLDCVLSESSNPDSGSVVNRNYYGRGSYTETLEYEVGDMDTHFIYFKFRKDGSVNSGMDAMKFRIRFED